MNLERNILSYLIDNPKTIGIALDTINEHCFNEYQNKLIFNAISELYKKDTPIDVFSVTDFDNKIKDMEYFDLTNHVLTNNDNLTMHLELLRAEGIRKQFKEIATKGISDIDNSISETEILNNTLKQLNDLHTFGSSKQIKSINASLEAIKQQIIDAKNGKGSPYAIGIDEVDNSFSFAASDLVLIGARPAMGKTAFVVSVFNYALYKGQRPVLFSLEMSTEQILLRMLSERMLTQSWRIKQGVCDFNEYDKHQQELVNLNPIIIDDCFTIDEIEAQLTKQSYLGSRIAFIDYLGLITPNKAQTREQEVSQMTRRLKMLAKKLNIPIVLLSQLSRAVEQRSNKRPMLSDLRDSGGIEQDADSVLFLYRDEYYGVFEADYGSTVDKAEVIVSKNRHGMVGTYVVDFIKDYTSFPNKLSKVKTKDIQEYYEQTSGLTANLDF
jgi:replicative DNA helicase